MIQSLEPLDSLSVEEPEFLQEFRKEAKIQFDLTGIPNTHFEDWKYTPVSKYIPESLKGNDTDSDIPILDFPPENIPFNDIDTYKIYLLNGKLIPIWSDNLLTPEFELVSIQNAFQLKEFRQFFNSINNKADPFSYLNTSAFDRGIFLKIKSGIKVSKPIHLIHLFSGNNHSIIHSRNLILIENLSEVCVLETFFEDNTVKANYFQNNLSEIVLEKGSKMEHIRYQTIGNYGAIINTDLVSSQKHSNYRSHTYSLSGKFIRNNLKINLNEPETETHLYGFYSINDLEFMDNHTLVRHLKPHCRSNELYKGVLKGKSIGVFNGRVEVSKDAQKTNAYQQNQTILLGKDSTMNSKPELEIFADDVKCSHGSTMGQLDKSALFYLQSRGISENTAQKIMINAFAETLLSEIDHSGIRKEIGIHIQELE